MEDFYWENLVILQKEYPRVKVLWVKEHAGNKWNEMADKLAKEGRQMVYGKDMNQKDGLV